MSDTKRYPTRMHEVLGVEPGERFTYSEYGDKEFWLSKSGLMHRICDDGTSIPTTQGTLVLFINHPEGIIRKPRLSEYAIDILKALKTLGYEWVRMDNQFCMWAYNSHPYRENWDKKTLISGTCYGEVLPILKHKEPLDIVATLKAAGGEG